MDKYTSSDKEKKVKSKDEKDKKKCRKLTKEKEYDEDWSLWDGMDLAADEVVVIRSEKRKTYRGVREGNWI